MEDPQPWQRPPPTPAQQRADRWLAALVAIGAAATTTLINSMGAFVSGTAPGLAEQLAWSVAMAVPLAVRRRFPVTVVLLIAAIFIAAQARRTGDSFIPSLVLFVALYTLGAWGRDRAAARWVRVGVILAMFAWLGVAMMSLLGTPPEFTRAAGPLDPVLAAVLYTVGINLLFFLVAYFFGNLAWESARRQDLLARQGEALRRSQAENARQAVISERLRIARDLHDVVAHHVAVMGVQAAAARRVMPVDPGRAQTSLRSVEQTARTAIGELRSLVGVLRTEPGGAGSGAAVSVGDEPASGDPPGPADPPAHQAMPGLAQLPGLVAKARAAGLRVTHAEYGEIRPVPEGVALSAYRIVQEAITNTVKHAGAAAVEIRVRYLDRCLEVEVNDDGRAGSGGPDGGYRGGPAGAPGDPPGGGLGIPGMRERVAVHGGELDVGPRPQGGFRVRARFPLPPVVASPAPGPAPAGAAEPAVTR